MCEQQLRSEEHQKEQNSRVRGVIAVMRQDMEKLQVTRVIFLKHDEMKIYLINSVGTVRAIRCDP